MSTHYPLCHTQCVPTTCCTPIAPSCVSCMLAPQPVVCYAFFESGGPVTTAPRCLPQTHAQCGFERVAGKITPHSVPSVALVRCALHVRILCSVASVRCDTCVETVPFALRKWSTGKPRPAAPAPRDPALLEGIRRTARVANPVPACVSGTPLASCKHCAASALWYWHVSCYCTTILLRYYTTILLRYCATALLQGPNHASL